MRPLLSGVLALAAVLAAGCGGAEERAQPAAGPAPAPTYLRIQAPVDGDELPAKRDAQRERLTASALVRGTAEPGAKVRVRAQCEDRRCGRVVQADAAGRWEARIRLVAPVHGRGASVVADYADPDLSESDLLTVLLRAPARRIRDAPRTRERSRKAADRPRRSAPPAAPTPQQPPAAPSPQPQQPQQPPASTARTLVMIGDSLAVGTQPHLPAALPGWRVTTDARGGRPLAEGMGALAAAQITPPAVLAFSLFTNDGPGDVQALERAVRTSVERAGPGGCAIWATIVRPPVGGRSYAAANATLTRLAGELAGRLRIVPWADAVAADPRLVKGDGVHATPEGYRVRAAMYADAARACGG